MKKIAIVAGTVALDITPEFPEHATDSSSILSEGKTIYMDGMTCCLGGLVSNTGIAMHKLGADVILSTKVGDDFFGAIVESIMKEHGVHTEIDISPQKATSATIVVAPKGKDRTFWHRRGASQEYSAEDLNVELLKKGDLFHFGYPTGMPCMHSDKGERLSQIFQRAKEYGLITSLDLSLPGIDSEPAKADWIAILEKTLPYVDIFLPSIEETLLLLNKEYYFNVIKNAGSNYAIDYIDLNVLKELSDKALSMGVKIFGLKLGKKGFYLRTADECEFNKIGAQKWAFDNSWHRRELLKQPYQIEKIVSTNGAGDTAIAGFLSGVLEGFSPENCLRLAAGAAAMRIQSISGVEGVIHFEKIMEKAQNGWQDIKIDLNSQYWSWDNVSCIYKGVHDKN